MSAQVEEVSASSQELAEQARKLQEVVAQFKLIIHIDDSKKQDR